MTSRTTKSIRISPTAFLAPIIANDTLVAFNVGPDGVIYLFLAQRPIDYRIEQPGWASFAKTIPDRPQAFRVVALSGAQVTLDVLIEGERFNIHDVQPLGEELLLVCARSSYRGPDDYERNGRVYDGNGRFLREVLLGDGIQTVQTTRSAEIWTSFFDEGIFGNYGWQEPVGASGLVARHRDGSMLYEFSPCAGLDTICDCYALNVESDDDVWLYYYTEFPLVRLHKRTIISFWRMPVSGSDAFAVSADHALFRGGYEHHDTYQLFALGSEGSPSLLAKAELHDERGARIVADRVVGRGDAVHLISGGFLYRVDVDTVLRAARQGAARRE